MADEKLIIEFEGQRIELASGFVGGIMNDKTNAPVGLYAGKLDIGLMGMSLTTLLRAIIKMGKEDMNLNERQIVSLINYSLKEAVKVERENDPKENVSLEQHQEILVKWKRDNK